MIVIPSQPVDTASIQLQIIFKLWHKQMTFVITLTGLLSLMVTLRLITFLSEMLVICRLFLIGSPLVGILNTGISRRYKNLHDIEITVFVDIGRAQSPFQIRGVVDPRHHNPVNAA